MTVEAMRPMSLGEILDRTFQIYRARFWVFVGIAAVPAAVLICFQFANLFWWKLRVPTLIPVLGVNFGSFLFAVGQYHLYLFIHMLGWGCMAVAAAEAHLDKQPSVHAAFSQCLRRWRSWLGMTALLWLIVLIIPEAVVAGFFLGITALMSEVAKASASTMEAVLPPLMGFFILAGFACSVWLGGVYVQAIPAWCVQQTGIRRSLRRAQLLSKGCRWKLIFARMVPALIGLVLNSALALLIRYLVSTTLRNTLRGAFSHRYLISSSYVLSAATVATLMAPIFPIAITLFYYDQRIRKEGYDIEYLMDAAGLNAAAVPVAIVAETSQAGDSVEAEVQTG